MLLMTKSQKSHSHFCHIVLVTQGQTRFCLGGRGCLQRPSLRPVTKGFCFPHLKDVLIPFHKIPESHAIMVSARSPKLHHLGQIWVKLLNNVPQDLKTCELRRQLFCPLNAQHPIIKGKIQANSNLTLQKREKIGITQWSVVCGNSTIQLGSHCQFLHQGSTLLPGNDSPRLLPLLSGLLSLPSESSFFIWSD